MKLTITLTFKGVPTPDVVKYIKKELMRFTNFSFVESVKIEYAT